MQRVAHDDGVVHHDGVLNAYGVVHIDDFWLIVFLFLLFFGFGCFIRCASGKDVDAEFDAGRQCVDAAVDAFALCLFGGQHTLIVVHKRMQLVFETDVLLGVVLIGIDVAETVVGIDAEKQIDALAHLKQGSEFEESGDVVSELTIVFGGKAFHGGSLPLIVFETKFVQVFIHAQHIFCGVVVFADVAHRSTYHFVVGIDGQTEFGAHLCVESGAVAPILLEMQCQRNLDHVDDLAFFPILHTHTVVVLFAVGVGDAVPRIDGFAKFAGQVGHRPVVADVCAGADTDCRDEKVGVADVGRERRQHGLCSGIDGIEQVADAGSDAELEVRSFAQGVNFGSPAYGGGVRVECVDGIGKCVGR